MTVVYIVVAIILDGAAALVAGLIPERALAAARQPLVGFAAGVLLGTTFLELLPEALAGAGARSGLVLGVVLASLVGMLAVEWWLRGRPRRRGGLAGVLLGADALHNVADGAAIAAAFLISPRLGLVTSVAVIAHEVPEEIADYVVLRQGGMTRRRAVLAMAAVQLTAGLGAALTIAGETLWAGAAGVVLAMAAGTFLHIVEVDLVPLFLDAGQGRPRPGALLALLAGLGVALAGLAFCAPAAQEFRRRWPPAQTVRQRRRGDSQNLRGTARSLRRRLAPWLQIRAA